MNTENVFAYGKYTNIYERVKFKKKVKFVGNDINH